MLGTIWKINAFSCEFGSGLCFSEHTNRTYDKLVSTPDSPTEPANKLSAPSYEILILLYLYT
jgi:hypothetical protein